MHLSNLKSVLNDINDIERGRTIDLNKAKDSIDKDMQALEERARLLSKRYNSTGCTQLALRSSHTRMNVLISPEEERDKGRKYDQSTRDELYSVYGISIPTLAHTIYQMETTMRFAEASQRHLMKQQQQQQQI